MANIPIWSHWIPFALTLDDDDDGMGMMVVVWLCEWIERRQKINNAQGTDAAADEVVGIIIELICRFILAAVNQLLELSSFDYDALSL